jgi:RNA polymerase sigma-70 factor (ECF subfamily)
VNANDHNASGPTDGPAVGPELLAWLLRRHAAALELYARQICECPEDVVQESLIGLAGQSTPPADVVAWLYRVVRNKAISAARSARRRKRRETVVGEQRTTWFSTPDDAELDTDAVRGALETLPSADREVIVARVWGGLSFQQIAELIGTSDSTAHRRYETALGKLRETVGVSCRREK